MPTGITRRLFFRRSLLASTGAVLLERLGDPTVLHAARPSRTAPAQTGTTPMILTSHSNDTGRRAVEAAWEMLRAGASAVDAVEGATNIIEEDPEDMSVGYGGLPNERGVVQLDASIMDGKTYNAGSVGALENIKHPSSVARLVMERTDHVMLVAAGALEFAKSWGFPEENLLTDRARENWLRWRETRSDRDDWGPPDHLRTEEERDAFLNNPPAETYGTVNVLAVDRDGHVAGITSTSGLSYKISGRIGDSPIIGAGLYVDNEVGAAGATGRGEDVIKACSSYSIVMRMREGRSPQEACDDALRMISERYKAAGFDYLPGEKFVAINKRGEFGCASMYGRRTPRVTIADDSGIRIHDGTIAFE